MSTKTPPLPAASEPFAGLTEHSVPAAAGPLLAKAGEIFGFVPNLAIVMAAAPSALEAYFNAQVGDRPFAPTTRRRARHPGPGAGSPRARHARRHRSTGACIAQRCGG